MSKQGSVKTIQTLYAATFSGRCPNVYTSSVREQDELSQTAHTHPLKGMNVNATEAKGRIPCQNSQQQ